MTENLRLRLSLDTAPVAGDTAPCAKVAAVVVAPPADRLAARAVVLFCLPGGSLAPSAYSSCPDLTLIIVPDTGHNHFVYATRGKTFARIAAWIGSLA